MHLNETYSCAILCGLEAVRSGLARRERTFSKTIHTVHLIRSQLSQTVPVDASTIGRQMARNRNLKNIAPIRNYGLAQSAYCSGLIVS
jgi:hypothetical protein